MKVDNAAIDFYLYITEMGAWLPIVYASSLEKGLQMLNEKLARPITPEWRTKVEKAYDVIGDVTANSTSLSSKMNEKMIDLIG